MQYLCGKFEHLHRLFMCLYVQICQICTGESYMNTFILYSVFPKRLTIGYLYIWYYTIFLRGKKNVRNTFQKLFLCTTTDYSSCNISNTIWPQDHGKRNPPSTFHRKSHLLLEVTGLTFMPLNSSSLLFFINEHSLLSLKQDYQLFRLILTP